MKIFITGSTGFIGKNLIEYYKDQHELWQHTREENIIHGLACFRPDIILNCAADIYDADAMWEPNVLWVHECLEYVKHNPNTKMIQIGSSSEYGKLSRAGTELDRINPSTMYEATKGAATLLCQGYARHYDLDICIARPYSVYGPHERPHRLFPRLWRAFYENEPMTLYHGVHDFIYIDDFVRGIDILIRHPNKPAGDIINFGSGSEYQNIEVLNYFKKITGKNAPVQYIDMMAKTFESDMWVCDPTYASEQYGFDTKFSLGTGIEEYIRRMKEL